MTTIAVGLDTDDDGSFATDITSKVLAMDSERGFSSILSRVQDVGELELWVDWRSDRTVLTKFVAGRFVRVRGTYGVTTTSLFMGMVQSVIVEDDARLRVRAVHRASGFDVPARLEMQFDQRSDVVMAALLDTNRLAIRGQLGSTAWVGSAQVGSAVVGSGEVYLTEYDTGKTTIAVFGDEPAELASVAAGVRAITLAEMGWFYEQGDGTITFRKRSYTSALSTSLTVAQSAIRMRYEAAGYGASVVQAKVQNRTYSAGATVLTTAEAWEVPAGSSIARLYPVDAEGRDVGMYGDVTVGGTALPAGVALDVSSEGRYLRAVVRNDTGAQATIGTGVTFTCNVVYKEEGKIIERGNASAFLGSGTITVGSMFDDEEEAVVHLDYMYNVFAGGRSRVEWFELVDDAAGVSGLDLLDVVSVTLTQPSHSARYLVGKIRRWLDRGRLRAMFWMIPFLDDVYAVCGITGRMEVGSVKVGY